MKKHVGIALGLIVLGVSVAVAADADSGYVAAITLIKQKQYTAALTLLESAVKEKPNSPRVHYARGFVLEKEDQQAEAISSYLTAVKLALRMRLREGQIMKQESEAAVKAYEALDRLAPDRTAILRKARDLEKEARDMDHNKVVIDAVQAMRQIAFDHKPSKRTSRRRKPIQVPNDAVKFRGHWYQVYKDKVNWHTAKAKCESMSGHLVTITSKAENAHIGRLAKSYGTNLWIGATDAKKEGRWEWISGEIWGFTAWRKGEPNNASGEDVAYIRREQPNWNDSGSSAKIAYVCEWE